MAKFLKTQSLREFQKFIGDVYSLPDDRLFSIEDLLTHQERFTMRALKGIRKRDAKKLRENLVIAFSWLMSVVNRLHIDLDDAVWRRFPFLCSYCAKLPCRCKVIKPKKRVKITRKNSLRPATLPGYQKMFSMIYPPESRELHDAGVHLAEEMGEVSEAVHAFMGEHKARQIEDATQELADYVSCFLGVANSAGIDISRELEKIFFKNCHVCHMAPCECTFSFIAAYSS